MYTGKMCHSNKIDDAVNAHKRDFPDTPVTHVALPKGVSVALRELYMGGYVRVDGVPLELTDEITPPPGHIWAGHINHE